MTSGSNLSFHDRATAKGLAASSGLHYVSIVHRACISSSAG